MQLNQKHHMVDFLFTITLLFLFAISSIALVVIGASAYQKSADSADQSFNNRTACLYITEKVRQYDGSGTVTVTQFGEGDALKLTETVNEINYNTYLYLYDGYLMELVTKEGSDLTAANGNEILKVFDFDISISEGGLLNISITCPSKLPISFYIDTHSATSETSLAQEEVTQ